MVLDDLVFHVLFPFTTLLFLLAEDEFMENRAAMITAIIQNKDITGTKLEKAPTTLITVTIWMWQYTVMSEIFLAKVFLIVTLVSCARYFILYIKVRDRQGFFHWIRARLYDLFKWVKKVLCSLK